MFVRPRSGKESMLTSRSAQPHLANSTLAPLYAQLTNPPADLVSCPALWAWNSPSVSPYFSSVVTSGAVYFYWLGRLGDVFTDLHLYSIGRAGSLQQSSNEERLGVGRVLGLSHRDAFGKLWFAV